jgi:hypothetical protein
MATHALRRLDEAAEQLRQARRTVVREPAADHPAPQARRPVRRLGTHRDQLIAAGQSVVWIAAFVQHIVNQVAGGDDSF